LLEHTTGALSPQPCAVAPCGAGAGAVPLADGSSPYQVKVPLATWSVSRTMNPGYCWVGAAWTGIPTSRVTMKKAVIAWENMVNLRFYYLVRILGQRIEKLLNPYENSDKLCSFDLGER
jgi:hypothetical protein